MNNAEVAAFFDFDKTLLEVESAKLGIKFMWDMRQISLWYIAKVLAANIFYQRHLFSDMAMARLLIKFYKGKRLDEFEAGAPMFYQEVVKPHLAPNILARVHEHKARGHRLVLISAGVRYLLKPVVEDLGFDNLFCTDLEVGPDGLLTGKAHGPICIDENKKIFTLKLAEEQGIDLEKSFAYGNHQSDIAFLELVGNPFVVEPTEPLRKMAIKRSWPVLSFR